MTFPDEKPASAAGTANPVAAAPVKTSKKYIVSTPWTCDSLSGEGFPEVTPGGVGMTEKEKDAAIAVADSVILRLNVEEAN